MQLRRERIHGHDIHYLIEGRGPVILLIHGMAGSSRTWSPVVRLLSDRYTLIAPDLIGHGESAKPATDYSVGAQANNLRDLLVQLGVDRATIVGQSLGGGIAMQLAYQFPERCERLVIVGSGGLGREVSWLLRFFAMPGIEYFLPVLFPAFLQDVGNRIRRFLLDRGIRAPHAEELWRAYTSLFDPGTRLAFVRTLRSVIDPGGQTVDATNRLYLAEAIPTMIVWGDRDDIIPIEHAYAAHEHIPGSRLEIFEGAGHFLHVEEPVRFARLLSEFMETTVPSAIETDAYRTLLATGSD